MRGCLGVLAMAVAFSFGAVWLGGPPVASGVVTVGLALAGFDAEDIVVDVIADPPLKLLTGRADELRVRARAARFGGLTAGGLDVRLVDVALGDRRAVEAHGALTDVVAGTDRATVAIESVLIDGPADGAAVVVRVPAAGVESLAARALEDAIGIVPGSVRLGAPDRLTFMVDGGVAEARLAVAPDGTLVASGSGMGGRRVVLIEAAAIAPIQLDHAIVENGRLVLSGTLDVESVLR